MMNRESREVSFYRRLSEVRQLYEKVKYAVILSENFDPEREFYVATSNQMRSALDHIFKAMEGDEKSMAYELKEAEEHLDRAGYDTYEILVSNLCLNISYKMDGYSASVISHVFPEYYKEIKPAISHIKIETGKLRTDKKENIDFTFDEYAQCADELVRFDEWVDVMIPAMEEFRKYEKRKNWKYWALTILIAFIFLLIGKFI